MKFENFDTKEIFDNYIKTSVGENNDFDSSFARSNKWFAARDMLTVYKKAIELTLNRIQGITNDMAFTELLDKSYLSPSE